MSNRVVNLLNQIVPKRLVLNMKPIFQSMPTGQIHQCLSIITEWLRLHNEEAEVVFSVTIESESAVSIKHISLTDLNEFLQSNSSSLVNNCQIVAIYHRSHSIDEVVRNLPQEIQQKSHLYRPIKAQRISPQFVASKNQTQKSENVKQDKQDKQDEKKATKVPLEKKSNNKKKDTKVLTNYSQARLELDQKVQKKEEEKKKNKMTLQSDEQYYDKQAFQKTLDMEEEKAKETDSSGKKNAELQAANQSKASQAPKLKLNYQCDSEDEDDLLAQMNAVEKKKAIKAQPPKPIAQKEPVIKKSAASKPTAQAGSKGGLLSWLAPKKAV